ncbi:hypothetical protein FG379_001157 [Cryptosporidium bovis]|uniref:uncharacterized protein n=1 Tax=Cryptosporidium bovis TaxID=310047 RepID=UPI00351A5F7C|nr:hypothetical protein FG379_001157 [Cryptosporidium bovis]
MNNLNDGVDGFLSCSNENEYLCDINAIESVIKDGLLLYRELGYNKYRNHTDEFVKLLEKYQEKPYILDNYLERICSPLTNIIAKFLTEISINLHESIINNDNESNKLNIDEHIQANIYRLSDCIYTLCKIRGLKVVSLYFPSEVRYLESVIDYITLKDKLENNSFIIDDNDKNWHFIYILYVWLTTLVLIPFSFQVLDSKYMYKEMDLFKRTLDIVIPKVMENKYCIINETSSYVFAKILCRTDFNNLWISNYSTIFDDIITNGMNKNPNSLGILIWIKYSVKLGPVESIELFIDRIINYLEIPTLNEKENNNLCLHVNGLSSTESSGEGNFYSIKSVSCKLVCISNIVIKCISNQQLIKYLNNSNKNILHWSLKLMMHYNKSNHSLLKHTSSKCIAKILYKISSEEKNNIYIGEILDDILLLGDYKLDNGEKNIPIETKYSNLNPNYIEGKCLTIAELIRKRINYVFENYLEEIIEFIKYCLNYQEWNGLRNLGTQIRDSACYIIWSLAKNVPSNMLIKYVNDIIISILPLTVFDTQINGRRSSCAALQELIGRQGGENIPFGISIVTIADFFTISSVKSSFIEVSTKIGSLNINNEGEIGIRNNNNNFKSISDYPFSDILINYLIKNVFNHPQIKYRLLSLVAFGKLVPYSFNKCYDEIMFNNVINLRSENENFTGISIFSSNPIYRHSSLLIASILLLKNTVFSKKIDFWNKLVFKNNNNKDFVQFSDFTLSDYIRNIPIMIEKNRLYRGKGGELTRKGVLCLIISICKSKEIIQFKKATFSRFLQSIVESIKHLSFSVQMSGTSALNALVEWRMDNTSNSPSYSEIEMLIKNFVSTINNESANIHIMALRGMILNIGLLFPKIVHLIKNNDLVIEIINCLVNVFNRGIIKVKNRNEFNSDKYILFSNYDIECRRNSLFSIGMVILNVKNSSNMGISISDEIFDNICTDLFIHGCFDYSVDKRGDVGSLIRELSMEIITCLYTNNAFINNKYFIDIISAFMFNIFNYSDKLRVKAILLLYKILCKLNVNDNDKYELNIYWIYYRIFYGIPYEVLELFLIKEKTVCGEICDKENVHSTLKDVEFIINNSNTMDPLIYQLFTSCSSVLENILEDYKLIYSYDQINDIKSFFFSETNFFNNSCFFFDLLDSIEIVPHNLLPYIDFDNQFLFYLSNRNFQIFSNSSVRLFKHNFMKFILDNSIQKPIIYGIINWISHSTSPLTPSFSYSNNSKEYIGYELNLFLNDISKSKNNKHSINSIYNNLKILIASLNNTEDGAISFIRILMHALEFVMILLMWDVSPCDTSILKDILLKIEDIVLKTKSVRLIKTISCIVVQISFNENVNKDIELMDKSLTILSLLISHEYPTIRSYTADNIYNNICYIQGDERIEKMIGFIRENQWEGDIDESQLLIMRMEFTRISKLELGNDSINVL